MDTKTRLLDTAEHLVRTKGFDAFSYADLSDAVGIRKASIHYHFATKADLASALIDRYSYGVLDELQSISDAHPIASDALRAYVRFYRDALGDGRQICLCVSFSAARDSFDHMTLTRLTAFHEKSRDWLSQKFEQANADGGLDYSFGSPDQEAAACLALVEGAQLIARAANDVKLFDQAVHPFLGRLAQPTLN